MRWPLAFLFASTSFAITLAVAFALLPCGGALALGRISVTLDVSTVSSSVMVRNVSLFRILMAILQPALVLPDDGDEPVVVLVDALFCAEIDEDPGPPDCFDSVLDHHGASDVPIVGFLADEVLLVLDDEFLVDVVFLGAALMVPRDVKALCASLPEVQILYSTR